MSESLLGLFTLTVKGLVNLVGFRDFLKLIFCFLSSLFKRLPGRVECFDLRENDYTRTVHGFYLAAALWHTGLVQSFKCLLQTFKN